MCMNRACLRRDDPGSQARFDETMRRDSVNPSDLRRCRPRMRTDRAPGDGGEGVVGLPEHEERQVRELGRDQT